VTARETRGTLARMTTTLNYTVVPPTYPTGWQGRVERHTIEDGLVSRSEELSANNGPRPRSSPERALNMIL